MKIFLLGATGNSGKRILRLAIQRDHEVTAFVRDEAKLLSVSVVLPCRVSVYQDGQTLTIATVKPTDLMKATDLNGVTEWRQRSSAKFSR